jgi:hypothetical protein
MRNWQYKYNKLKTINIVIVYSRYWNSFRITREVNTKNLSIYKTTIEDKKTLVSRDTYTNMRYIFIQWSLYNIIITLSYYLIPF